MDAAPELFVLIYKRGRHWYIWRWQGDHTDEALRSFGRFAVNPELNFSWWDTKKCSAIARKMVQGGTPSRKRRQRRRGRNHQRWNRPFFDF